MFPEHTELAYREAKKQGADVIECDVTVTKVRKEGSGSGIIGLVFMEPTFHILASYKLSICVRTGADADSGALNMWVPVQRRRREREKRMAIFSEPK